MALAHITQVSGKGVFVPGDDIDTDRIIPARYLKCVTFDDLAEGMFADVRFSPSGEKMDHNLNDPRFAGASIMISNKNFGCGSSREHAPQSIYRSGFRAVIAESFAEIFFGNSTMLGMPCVEASKEVITALSEAIERDPRLELSIDIAAQTLSSGDTTVAVSVRDTARDAFVNGSWDPLSELLAADDAIGKTSNHLAYMAG